PYLRPGLTASDTMQRLAADVIMLTAGSKIAQAGAYPAAYARLDSLLMLVAPRHGADTLGPKQQIRINASFWSGIPSVFTLTAPQHASIFRRSVRGFGAVAQLVRVPVCHTGGRGFEPRQPRLRVPDF